MSSAESVCKLALNWIIQELYNKNEKEIFVIGIGSGSTIVPFVELLGDFAVSNPGKTSIICIPTSEQARHLILSHLINTNGRSFKLGTLDEYQTINVTVDGADSVYFESKFLVKGGGAAHCQEKIIAEASENYLVVVADEKKIEKPIESVAIPVEVIPLALNSVIRLLKAEFGTDLQSCNIRNCPSGCGKIGPIVTDNGNLIIDLHLSSSTALKNLPRDLDSKIRQYAGVVETGIFWRLPKVSLVIFPEKYGQVIHKSMF